MLGNFITSTLVVIVVLGIMIFVHELGHFMAAKFFGVRVLVFSLGFGKTLFHFQRGDTDYRVSALPFGGYVKMAGDDPTEVREGDRGEFLSQPRWKRFIIVVMGPAMNVLLSIVLLTGLYRFHFERPAYVEQPATIGDVEPNSPAAQAHIEPGDLILRLGAEEHPKWEDVDYKILTAVNKTIPVVLERNGEIVNTAVTPVAKGSDQVGYVGWEPASAVVLDKVEPGLPADKAGLRVGDEIDGVDGRPVNIAYAIKTGDGKPITFDVLREGKELRITVQPVYGELSGEKRWRVGFQFHNSVVIRHLPFRQAFNAALDDNARNCLATFDVLGKILTRQMSPRTLSGPIRIAQLSGEAYRAGMPELILLVSFISLQLGIFNLLPIPVLDGGQILLLLVEGLMRRDLSLEVKERFVQVGIVFLLLLAAFVMYNDLVKTLRPY